MVVEAEVVEATLVVDLADDLVEQAVEEELLAAIEAEEAVHEAAVVHLLEAEADLVVRVEQEAEEDKIL